MTNKKSTKLTALLTALVLVTSLFVGGTIARYVTSTSSEDSARVAVWGINEAGTTMNLFENEYTIDGSGELKAKSEDDDDIIAPGLNGASQFKIVNTSTLKPEVMYEIAISLDDSEIADEIKNHPGIEWKVDNGEWGTWEEFKAELLSLSGDPSGVKVYAPLDVNHEFANSKTHTVAWQWIMDSGYDVEDTAMGNYVAETGDITAKLSITVTARQTDVDSTGMLEGNGSVYNTLNPQPLVFRSAAPVDELVEVKVDDETLTENDDYTVSSGSTIITLTDSYLENLEVGKYTISIISNNMTAKATFKVVESEEVPDNTLIHNGVIPEGGVYYRGIDSIYDINEETDMFYSTTQSGIIETADEIFTENNNFPSTPQTGDVYVYEDYEYRYNYKLDANWMEIGYNNIFIEDTSLNGWGVYCTRQTTSPTEILTTINNKNVVNVDYLFYERNINNAPTIPNTINSMISTFQDSNITNAPVIPNSVTNLTSTFQGSNITNAPIIPSSVTNLTNTFADCENLTGILTINSNPTQYTNMLCNTNISNIQGSISNELKNEIRRTYDFMNPELIIPGETIPNGGIYYRGIQAVYDEDFGEDLYKHGDYTTATETYIAGDTFPEPQSGDTFVYNGEEYRYNFYDDYNDYYGFIQWTENNSNEWDPSYIEAHDNY